MGDTNIVNVGTEKFNEIWSLVQQYALAFGIKILAAIAFWVIGRWLIGLAVGMVERALARQSVDPTLLRYVGSFITVTLNIVLVIGILGYFGVQTTSLAALIAAAGVAIGMAWSGLLANLAAGGFIIVLRPFKVGDFVSAGGVTGTVKEIGLFATAINTPDNVLTLVGNNKIFGDTIQNFSHNTFRRVDLKAQLSGAADYQAAAAVLKQRIAAIPNVLSDPPVDVEILEFNLVGPVLAVRPYCHNNNYWQVYFDTNRTIKEALGTDFPAPMPAQTVIVAIAVAEWHAHWPWSAKRWSFVADLQSPLATHRWFADAATLRAALADARSVQAMDDPHAQRLLRQVRSDIALRPVPRLFAPVDRTCTSFSQWWHRTRIDP